jgi:glucose/mannose transport system substrate-binding protein
MGMSRRGVLTAGLALAVAGCSSSRAGNGEDQRVEIFSWWVGPGEKEALDALVADFTGRNAGIGVDLAAVAGGAGTNARAVLARRLKDDQPPDSYQVHAGQETQGDVKAGDVVDLSYLYQRERWNEVLPAGLLEAITVDGRIYSVPVNIHRANLLWYRPKMLAAAGLSGPPATWAQLLAQAPALRARHMVPLAIGPGWTQKHLLETVLLGELGADRYNGLWTGRTDWRGADVLAAIGMFGRLLDVSDLARAAGDWQPALDNVISGAAAYCVMGDWADAYLGHTKKLTFRTDYAVVPTPGSAGVYDFLSDSFTLPKHAPHRSAAEKWLVECGSVNGQDAFNPLKGSVPARTDIDKSKYTGYLATALADWQDGDTVLVGSLTHGVVANTTWNAAIDTALAVYVKDRSAQTFADAVAKSYTTSR